MHQTHFIEKYKGVPPKLNKNGILSTGDRNGLQTSFKAKAHSAKENIPVQRNEGDWLQTENIIHNLEKIRATKH